MRPDAGPRRRRSRAPTRFARIVALSFALAAVAPAGAVESAVVVSPDPSLAAELAFAVGLDGTTLAVGAPGENEVAGAAYVVDCAALPCGSPLRIAPAELVAGDAFGSAVGVSGSTLVVTAPGTVPSAAWVYVGNGASWSQQAKLAPGAITSGERFGRSVSISGDRIAVGADQASSDAGAVYVFVRTGVTWTEEQRLTGADTVAFDAFGTSVALDGDTLVVGAPMKRAAAAGSYANGAV
jgi:FG-GAP repeat protein